MQPPADRPAPPMLEVGRVARAHGLRGAVVVEMVTNREERVAPGAQLVADGGRRLEVRSASPSGQVGGRHRFVVHFEGVDDRDGAEALRGLCLRAAPLERPGVLWVHDLIGAEVRTVEGSAAGRVVAVEANPASDLLVLDSGGLVPLAFVVEAADGRVTIDPPAGLLEG